MILTDSLEAVYTAFLAEHLPQWQADELPADAMTPAERAFSSAFMRLWEIAEQVDRERWLAQQQEGAG